MEGVSLGMLNLYLLLYADDIILFANTPEALQQSLNVLAGYCDRGKLTVNGKKSKIIIFRKGGKDCQVICIFTTTKQNLKLLVLLNI